MKVCVVNPPCAAEVHTSKASTLRGIQPPPGLVLLLGEALWLCSLLYPGPELGTPNFLIFQEQIIVPALLAVARIAGILSGLYF